MANSINVTQNKWACITQLKGRSGCLCRSHCCCSLRCALPALSLVRGHSCWRISVWMPLHQALVQAVAAQNGCSTAKGKMGKKTGSFVWFRWSTLLCSLCPHSLRLQAPVLLTLSVMPRTTLVSFLPEELWDKVLPPSMGFLSFHSSWERIWLSPAHGSLFLGALSPIAWEREGFVDRLGDNLLWLPSS